jgi:hypothetical protein
MSSLIQAVFYCTVADDRPSNKLGEHGNVGSEVDEAFLHAYPAVIQIDCIGKNLEGVKADSDGKQQIQRQNRYIEYLIDVVDEEEMIFKKQQRTGAEKYRGYKSRLLIPVVFSFVHPQSVQVSGSNREHHQYGVNGLSIEVKK